MLNKLPGLLILFLLIVILWMAYGPQPDSTNQQKADDTAALKSSTELLQRIEQLEQDLAAASLERETLEQRLAQLEQDKQSTKELIEPEPVTAVQAPPEQSVPRQPIEDFATVQARLLDAGMARETAASMKQWIDQNQLERLQLRNRAIREGWQDTLEFSEQMHELSNPFRGVREEFGDQAYDMYLYATNTPNRVQVREVYSGSAAHDAGLKAGDIFISYAEQAVYDMSDLRQATVDGNAGETVLIEVLRDDFPYSSSVPRGPLGISMSMTVMKP